jgi:hypothetical protein
MDLTNPQIYTVTSSDGNERSFTVHVVKVAGSGDNAFVSFSIPNQTCDVSIVGSNVTVAVYKHVDISQLSANVVISDLATVNPPSGSTIDFTIPVTYTITAWDGSEATYTVTVNKNLSRRNDIEQFQLVGTEQIFEREGDDLFIYVPYETDVTSIATEITISVRATISPASGIPMDFTNPQIYTVTSSDGTSKNYSVVVKKSPWKKVATLPFSRDEIGCLVFKEKLWILSGWIPGQYLHSGEVWNSSDGINWQQVVSNAPWQTDNAIRFTVFKDNIYALNGGLSRKEIWRSGDGIYWEKVVDNVPFGVRQIHM